MTNKVTHAPKAVIDELDAWQEMPEADGGIYQFLSDVYNGNLGDVLIRTKSWVCVPGPEELQREYAIIDHIFGNERLQPERETRWTVRKIINGYNKSLVFENGETNFREYTDRATYMFGLTEEQARGYAELFGGEAKEIK